MSKTLAECTGINQAAFSLACARLEALRKVKAQSELITEIRAKHSREVARELAQLETFRTEAEKIGAYEIIAPAATVVAS